MDPITSSDESEPASAPRRGIARIPVLVAIAAVALHLSFAIGDLTRWSPTQDELVHLASGWTALHWNDYRINPEHPPLAKLVAASAISSWLPASPESTAPANAGASWHALRRSFDAAPMQPAAEWYFAHYFSNPMHDGYLRATGARDPALAPVTIATPREAWLWDLDSQLIRARLAMLLFPIGLAIAMFVWGSREASPFVGAVAVVLLALDPSFIAHGALVATDVAGAAGIAWAVFALYRWMQRGRSVDAALLAVATGTALVLKFSALLLAGLFPLLIVIQLLRDRTRAMLRRGGLAVLIAIAGAYILIWSVYGFRWSATSDGTRLGTADLFARSAAIDHLREADLPLTLEVIEAAKRDRQPGATAGYLLMLHASQILPEGFTHGIAYVRAYAHPRNAFLDGRISREGFPSYFARTIIYKTPPPVLAALLLVAIQIFRRRIPAALLIWWGLPAALIFISASVSGVNIGHRHILSLYPFLWLLCATAIVRTYEQGGRSIRATVIVLGAWLLLAPFAVVTKDGLEPVTGHHLSYFNEIAGGPSQGATHLVDSNLDWGQDASAAAEWWRENGRGTLAWAVSGTHDPRRFGFPLLNTPFGYPHAPMVRFDQLPADSTLALSATSRSGVLDDPASREAFREFLREWVPAGKIGYSIELYRRDDRTGVSFRN